ncbi:hypothetical protein NC652_026121 [Populus alba x Populus x berolinensis]|nr:hypothetical protein NC652_026121 [Populus alba x Populus x berolinensis]
MGFHRSSIGRILDMHPCLLTSDPHLHLHPTFDFLLNEVEIPFLDISRSINRCPRLLVSSVSNQLRPALVFLKELGFVGPRKLNYQTTLLLVYNVERSLMGKIEFLMGLGFEFVEVKNMVVRAPGILTLSVERNMKPKFEYFVREMKGDPGELKKFPQFFSFSLERKIKPRHRMLVEYGLNMPLSNNQLFNLCCFGEDCEGIEPRPVSYSVPYCSWIYIILAFTVLIFVTDQLVSLFNI